MALTVHILVLFKYCIYPRATAAHVLEQENNTGDGRGAGIGAREMKTE
jgi:hypothetical protein